MHNSRILAATSTSKLPLVYVQQLSKFVNKKLRITDMAELLRQPLYVISVGQLERVTSLMKLPQDLSTKIIVFDAPNSTTLWQALLAIRSSVLTSTNRYCKCK